MSESVEHSLPVAQLDEQANLRFYTLKDAMALSPRVYEDWVYSKTTRKVDEVRIVSSKRLNRILTKCSWWIPFVFWPPVIAYLLWPLNLQKGMALVGGFVLWFPVEYLFHRFLFHMPVRGKVTQFIHYMLHGIHHVAPHDLDHLVSPPLELGVQALAIYGVLRLLHAPYPECILAGLLIQYLRYDLTHYSVHAFDLDRIKRMPLVGGFLLKCKRHHMQHHFVNSRAHYTISYTTRWVD